MSFHINEVCRGVVLETGYLAARMKPMFQEKKVFLSFLTFLQCNKYALNFPSTLSKIRDVASQHNFLPFSPLACD